MGSHFGVSVAPREDILAPPGHAGGPWGQQDGHEVANDWTSIDFGIIFGPVYVSFWGSKCVKNVLFCGLLPGHLLSF